MPQKNVASNTEKSLLVIVVKVLVHICFAKVQNSEHNTKEKQVFLSLLGHKARLIVQLGEANRSTRRG